MHPYEARQGRANVDLALLYLRYATAFRDYQDAVARGCRGMELVCYLKRIRLYAVRLCEHYPEVVEARRWAVAIGVN